MMDAKTMSPAEVRRVGMEALLRALGPAGMARFLQQGETGQGDYSADRHRWLGGMDVATLAGQLNRARPEVGDGSG